MKDVHIGIGILSIVLFGIVGVWGAWCWWRVRASRLFWVLLRVAQAVVVVAVADGGLLRLAGHKSSSLHLIYGLLPLLVSFIAEQLRIASAEMILGARGYESAAEVGALAKEEQQEIVMAIIQREIGVMTLAALVIVVLLARAAGT